MGVGADRTLSPCSEVARTVEADAQEDTGHHEKAVTVNQYTHTLTQSSFVSCPL